MDELNTDEQQQAITRILRCQNHYAVLNVPMNATNQNIVDAYKNQARLVHPDKNHHPQAEEAMKKVTKAREILSDAITRREYDLTIQPNENLRANVENYGYDDYPFDHSHQNWWSTEFRVGLLILLPVILLLLMPALVSVLKPQTIYSLTLNAKFSIRRRTMAGKIPYYVTKDFSAEIQKYYSGSLGDVEKKVKTEYKMKLERACQREKSYKQHVLEEALKSINNPYWYERVERAKSLETPSCRKLQIIAYILNQPTDSISSTWQYYFNLFTKFLR